MERKLYQELASSFIAYNNCVASNNTEWQEKHYEVIQNLISKLPHGSGIDGKTELNFEKSKSNKLIINSEFHVMDENGFYEGWINFSLIITPSWNGIDISIKGNFGKHQELKDYLVEIFGYELEKVINI
jgi:hypothetical protein